MNQHVQAHQKTSTKWAPWWVYFVVIVGANYLRRATSPQGSTPEARLVVALGFSAALFVVITLIYALRAVGDEPPLGVGDRLARWFVGSAAGFPRCGSERRVRADPGGDGVAGTRADLASVERSDESKCTSDMPRVRASHRVTARSG